MSRILSASPADSKARQLPLFLESVVDDARRKLDAAKAEFARRSRNLAQAQSAGNQAFQVTEDMDRQLRHWVLDFLVPAMKNYIEVVALAGAEGVILAETAIGKIMDVEGEAQRLDLIDGSMVSGDQQWKLLDLACKQIAARWRLKRDPKDLMQMYICVQSANVWGCGHLPSARECELLINEAVTRP